MATKPPSRFSSVPMKLHFVWGFPFRLPCFIGWPRRRVVISCPNDSSFYHHHATLAKLGNITMRTGVFIVVTSIYFKWIQMANHNQSYIYFWDVWVGLFRFPFLATPASVFHARDQYSAGQILGTEAVASHRLFCWTVFFRFKSQRYSWSLLRGCLYSA